MNSVGREQSIQLNIVVSSGTGTGTLTNAWTLARWIRVKPISETDTYDLTIKDSDGIIMLKRTSQLGTFSERLEMSLGIMRTFLIENATADGTYQSRLDLH
jgi:hypothetical protein